MNWCPLESHPETSGHPVRYYCRCLCLGTSHMVIVHFVLQPPLRGLGSRQILEMRRLLKILNLFSKHTCSMLLSLINFKSIKCFFTAILFGILLYYILFVQRLLLAPASKGALINMHYYYYYYYYYYIHISLECTKSIYRIYLASFQFNKI